MVSGFGCGPTGAPPAFPEPDADLTAANVAMGDPYEGRFPLEEALADLPPGNALIATLQTSEGAIRCRLDPDHAPLSVANFVGLARGLRPFREPDGAWVRVPYYAEMPWHRAVEGQLVQTGRRGTLAHGGFFLQDEVGYGDSFDRGGVLAMANTGSEHSGSVEFFVTTAPAAHLEGGHTILGECDDEATVRRIERRVVRDDKPSPTLVRIDISRQ
ncbi:MAG: peptidylprolyl isomerase [Myxococcota bacterium]